MELASLLVASAELVSSKLSEKGVCVSIYSFLCVLSSLISWLVDLVCIFDSDFECTYIIICSIVKNANSPEDDVLDMVKVISAKLVQQPNDKASLRLKMYDSFQLICSMFCL